MKCQHCQQELNNRAKAIYYVGSKVTCYKCWRATLTDEDGVPIPLQSFEVEAPGVSRALAAWVLAMVAVWALAVALIFAALT